MRSARGALLAHSASFVTSNDAVRDSFGPAPRNDADTRGSLFSCAAYWRISLSQIRSENRSAKTCILRLKFLQAIDLIGLQTVVLPVQAIVGNFAYADLKNRIRNTVALRHQAIDLAQLRDDFFGLVSLPRHEGPHARSLTTLGWTFSVGVDHLISRA